MNDRWSLENGNECFRFKEREVFERPWIIISIGVLLAVGTGLEYLIRGSSYWKRKKNVENFNVEDYFTCQLFRKYIFSFSSLDTIKGKDGLKSKLEDECSKGRIAPKYFEKFSTLFDHILAIKDAEARGLTKF